MSYEKIGWKPGSAPFINADNLDHMDQGIKAASDLQRAKVAGGTGTVISLSDAHFDDGLMVSFIVAANNLGQATSINGKPLYKPGTTQAPNLKQGKNVTIWYQAQGDCFFYKASAEGNALSDQVLATRTFSNDDDTGILGTMANHGSVGSVTLSQEGSEYTIPKGFHNGLGKVKATISGLLSSVIKAGSTVGGIVGNFTADATALAANIYPGKTAYVNGQKVTGTMPYKSGAYKTDFKRLGTNRLYMGVPGSAYYHNDAQVYADDPNFDISNIRKGVRIFGLLGYYDPDPHFINNNVVENMLTGKRTFTITTTKRPKFVLAEITRADVSNVYAECMYIDGEGNRFREFFSIGLTVDSMSVTDTKTTIVFNNTWAQYNIRMRYVVIY